MKKLLLLFVFAAFFAGCKKDFLDDKAYSVITQDNFYKSASDALTALNGVYNALQGSGMYEDDLLRLNEYTTEAVTSDLTVDEIYSRIDTWRYQVGDFASIYSGQYRLIERANQVIANVPNTDMNETLRQRVIAEATFLRALGYFNLVRVYGGVPLKLTPTVDFSQTSFARASAADVYSQIITDLTGILQSNALPLTGSYAAADKGRAGKSAVQALLGKVYLTRASDQLLAKPDDYQKAVTVLAELVADNDRALLPHYKDVFDYNKENHAEVIFDVQYLRKAGLGGNLTAFIPTTTTQELFQISYYDYLASIDFYNSFETGDTRKAVTFYDSMTVKINGNVVPVYFDATGDPSIGMWRRFDDHSVVPRGIISADVPGFRKFVDYDLAARQNAEEPNFIILRYSDVLLMLAEALNEVNGGPTSQAYEYLNMVKRRAFGKPINIPDLSIDYNNLDKQGFRRAVYNERRKEFVLESQGWFDGKRFWDIFTARVAAESVGADPNFNLRPKKTILVTEINQDKYRLMPFSQSNLDLNKELTQNPGYN